MTARDGATAHDDGRGRRRANASARGRRLATLGLRASVAMLAAFVLAVVSAGAFAQQSVPPLQARVTDQTGTLTVAQRQQLEAQLAAIEQRQGSQVAVLIVPTTRPEPIEAYAIRVAEAWRLGRGAERAQRDSGDRGARSVDDGVLIIVAKDDRRVRIEVGYGLEGAIPDAIARRIIAEAITPRFRDGDFAGGLQAAIADIGRRIAGEALPPPWQPGDDAPSLDGRFESLLPALIVSFLVGVIVSKIAGRFIGAVLGGVGAGVSTTGVIASTLVGGVAGLAMFVLVLAVGGGGGGGGRLRRVGRRTIGHGPVVIPGGWGGGGFGGGGSGGGGFSGGGGGFGGGGASGDW